MGRLIFTRVANGDEAIKATPSNTFGAGQATITASNPGMPAITMQQIIAAGPMMESPAVPRTLGRREVPSTTLAMAFMKAMGHGESSREVILTLADSVLFMQMRDFFSVRRIARQRTHEDSEHDMRSGDMVLSVWLKPGGSEENLSDFEFLLVEVENPHSETLGRPTVDRPKAPRPTKRERPSAKAPQPDSDANPPTGSSQLVGLFEDCSGPRPRDRTSTTICDPAPSQARGSSTVCVHAARSIASGFFFFLQHSIRHVSWRRGQDLNLRTREGYTLSKRAP